MFYWAEGGGGGRAPNHALKLMLNLASLQGERQRRGDMRSDAPHHVHGYGGHLRYHHCRGKSETLHPTPEILHLKPFALHPTPCILHSTHHTQNTTP